MLRSGDLGRKAFEGGGGFSTSSCFNRNLEVQIEYHLGESVAFFGHTGAGEREGSHHRRRHNHNESWLPYIESLLSSGRSLEVAG